MSFVWKSQLAFNHNGARDSLDRRHGIGFRFLLLGLIAEPTNHLPNLAQQLLRGDRSRNRHIVYVSSQLTLHHSNITGQLGFICPRFRAKISELERVLWHTRQLTRTHDAHSCLFQRGPKRPASDFRTV
ncbi:hypothetical protein BVI1335_830063 [Burkholderia vietnamiensis]|nr:hypothetical protein BVI1335_830063 [Burkholderia vietnamiensis]